MNVARKLSGILSTISVNGFASNWNFLAQTLKYKALLRNLKQRYLYNQEKQRENHRSFESRSDNVEGAYIFVKHYFQCNLHNFIDTHFNISILLYKIIWNSLIWSDPFMTWRTLNCRFQCQPIEMSLSKISIVSILRFYHSSFSFAFSDEPKHMFHGIRRRIISCQNFHPGCL